MQNDEMGAGACGWNSSLKPGVGSLTPEAWGLKLGDRFREGLRPTSLTTYHSSQFGTFRAML
jgi:hypothetical protein